MRYLPIVFYGKFYNLILFGSFILFLVGYIKGGKNESFKINHG